MQFINKYYFLLLILFPICIKAQFWSSLDTGLNNIVYALEADTVNNLIYVGGNFSYPAGVDDTMRFIGKWDGQGWRKLGAGNELIPSVPGAVYTLHLFNNILYVGGSFNSSSQYIVQWDGQSWSAMDYGFYGSCNCQPGVHSIINYQNEIYAGGGFPYIFGASPSDWILTNNITRWDGTLWGTLGSGLNDTGFGFNMVSALQSFNGYLYAGGFFNSAGGVPIGNNIAKWDGMNWFAVPGYPGFATYCFTIWQNKLYSAGLASEIIEWDGINWDTIGTIWGSNSQVHALTVYNNELIVGGFFSTINGMQANNIAKWDGASWSTLGSGTSSALGNGTVEALAVLNNELYVGGWFEYAGGIPASYIAKWGGCGPYINFSQNKDTVNLAVSGQVIFTNQSAVADSFLWDFGDGTTDTAQNPTHIYDTIGTYTITLTGFRDSCSKSVTSTITVVNTIGIPDNYLQNEIKIYSNPFNNTLKIEFAITKHSEILFTLYNFTGKEISRIKKNNLPKGTHLEQFNTEQLSPGLYLLLANICTHALVPPYAGSVPPFGGTIGGCLSKSFKILKM